MKYLALFEYMVKTHVCTNLQIVTANSH